MLNNAENYKELGELILAVLNGNADSKQVDLLRSKLEQDPYAMQYYCEYVSLYSALRQPGNVSFEAPQPEVRVDESTLGYIWEELAEQEQTAQSVRIRRRRWPWKRKKKKTQPEIRSVGKAVKLQRQFSKAAIYTAITSAAAMLLVAAHIFVNEHRAPIVATLTDAVNSRWHRQTEDYQVGDNLRTIRKTLIEGVAKLQFKSGTEVVLQGPAEIEPENENQLMLYSGSIFSKVPPQATGFVVRTPNATVIDYGTEFGVTSLPSGKTEVHVFDGEVEIRVGSDPVRHGATRKLYAGQAGIVDAEGKLEMIQLADHGRRFARNVPEKGFATSGSRFDLTDLVAGGNGYGTGQLGRGIDPISGQVVDEFTGSSNRLGTGIYKQLPDNPFIDGVFVPDGDYGPQQVSSQGHFCSSIPDTTGVFWSEITTDAKIAIGYTAKSERYPVRLDGIEYGSARNPAILMHANLGITFDLDKIRELLPCQRIETFKAICGLSEPDWDVGNADFRVIVDGDERFAVENVKVADGAYDVEVPIDDGDRFLTLVTTDGGGESGNGKDWTVFAQPHLEVTPTSIEDLSDSQRPDSFKISSMLEKMGFRQ